MGFVFNHQAICSKDLKRSERFYQDFMELKKVKDWCGGAEDGSWRIDFYCDGVSPWMLEVKWTKGYEGEYDHGTIGADHIAFAHYDVQGCIDRARELGYTATDKDENGNCMITDPDGYLIEVCDAKALEEE